MHRASACAITTGIVYISVDFSRRDYLKSFHITPHLAQILAQVSYLRYDCLRSPAFDFSQFALYLLSNGSVSSFLFPFLRYIYFSFYCGGQKRYPRSYFSRVFPYFLRLYGPCFQYQFAFPLFPNINEMLELPRFLSPFLSPVHHLFCASCFSWFFSLLHTYNFTLWRMDKWAFIYAVGFLLSFLSLSYW